MTISTKDIFLFLILIRPLLDIFADVSVFGMNPASILAILIIAIFILEFVLTGYLQTDSNKMLKGFIVYFVLLIPSMFSSDYLGESFTELLKYLCELSCIWLTFHYCSLYDGFKEKILNVMLRSSIIPSVVGFYQIITNTGLYDKEVGATRVYSVFVHPNQYAIYIVIIATISFLFIFNTVKCSRREKVFATVILVCNLINLLFTYSRTCWVWLAVVVIGIIIFNANNKWIIAIDILLVIAAYYLSDMIFSRFADVTSGSKSSLDIRTEIVSVMMVYVVNKPIIGHGLGTFDHWSLKYVGTIIQAHNEYFKTLFESGVLGIFGLIIYFANTIVSLIKKGIKKNYITIFFFIGFLLACYYTNTLSSLSGQIYFVIYLTTMLLPEGDYNELENDYLSEKQI